MRLKKGFTLAEILIVLMVIGAIATMTIPSLMKGVTESQWKTAYKKAYNTVINLCAMERIAGNLPSTNDANGAKLMFTSLNASLAVKDYVRFAAAGPGITAKSSDYTSNFTMTNAAGDTINPDTGLNGAGQLTYQDASNTQGTPWIVTEDNFAYSVLLGDGCGTKGAINSVATGASPKSQSCVIVMVDVNGLSNGPNTVEPNVEMAAGDAMPTLTGDRYYIYIGRDGATAGPKTSTVAGRIAADLK